MAMVLDEVSRRFPMTQMDTSRVEYSPANIEDRLSAREIMVPADPEETDPMTAGTVRKVTALEVIHNLDNPDMRKIATNMTPLNDRTRFISFLKSQYDISEQEMNSLAGGPRVVGALARGRATDVRNAQRQQVVSGLAAMVDRMPEGEKRSMLETIVAKVSMGGSLSQDDMETISRVRTEMATDEFKLGGKNAKLPRDSAMRRWVK
jgi:hypothetical protein